MAPFRASRSTRSGRPGGQNDQDVFDGLPVRQWRLQDATLGANDEPAPTPDVPARTHGIWKELPMPKGSEHYTTWCQQILQAARTGRILTSAQNYSRGGIGKTAKDEDKENDKDEAAEGAGDEGLGKRVRTPVQGFIAKRWAQTSKQMEEPETEYLAKRRKGLPSLHAGVETVITAPPPVYAGPMRKTKVKRVDAGGNATVWEVLVPEGETVPGEITEPGAVENAGAPISAPPPGTVIEGLGVTNEEGVVVANILPAPILSATSTPRIRAPRKKTRGGFRKGRSRKLGYGDKGGVSASAEALYASREGGADGIDTAVASGVEDSVADGPVPIGGDEDDDDGEMDEDDDADDAEIEGEDGQMDGDDDDDREEGEITPSPEPPDPADLLQQFKPSPVARVTALPVQSTRIPLPLPPKPPMPASQRTRDRSSSPDLPLSSANKIAIPGLSTIIKSEMRVGDTFSAKVDNTVIEANNPDAVADNSLATANSSESVPSVAQSGIDKTSDTVLPITPQPEDAMDVDQLDLSIPIPDEPLEANERSPAVLTPTVATRLEESETNDALTEDIVTDGVSVEELETKYAAIEKLEADNASIEEIDADNTPVEEIAKSILPMEEVETKVESAKALDKDSTPALDVEIIRNTAPTPSPSTTVPPPTLNEQEVKAATEAHTSDGEIDLLGSLERQLEKQSEG